MAALISESETLRVLNLADTPHWRNWVRAKMPILELSTGRFYDRGLVEKLAAQIRPLNGDIVLPPEHEPAPQRAAAPEPLRVGFGGAVDSGSPRRAQRAEALTDRDGPQLETR
jgi:hypothetical protein